MRTTPLRSLLAQIDRVPLGLTLAVVVVAGIAVGVVTPARATDAMVLAMAGSAIALALDRAAARRTLMLMSLACLAAADGAVARDRALSSPLQSWFDSFAPDGRAPDAVSVEGTLAEDASVSDDGVRLVIDVGRVGSREMAGRVQAHVSGVLAGPRAVKWTAGRPIRVPIWLHRLQVWRNPGSPTEQWQQLRRTCDLAGTIKSGALIDVQPGSAWDESAAAVRRYVRDVATTHVAPLSAQSAAIVAAILIGDRAGLDPEIQRRLQAAGTYHVIAISGGNIAILTTVCLMSLRGLVRSPRVGAVITMAVVIGYGWLVGNDPSVRRAVVAACFYLALGLVGLMPRALPVLGVVAMVVAASDPLTVVDIGAWLSFGATLGIVLCAGRFMRWTSSGPTIPAPTLRSPVAAACAKSLKHLWAATLGLLSATLAAEIVLTPISAAVFSRVSVAGLVLNFAAIPAMAVVQIGGIVMTAVAGWWPGGAHLVGIVTYLAAQVLVGSSEALDLAPWLSWRVPPTWIGWTVLFYLAFALCLWLREWGWPRVVAAATLTACLLIVVTAPGLEWAQPARGRLRVTMIDVGQGDAMLVQFPTGHSMMVDTGGAGRAFDIGGRVVTPAAWALGVRRLDWLAVTHADLDHIGGAISVVRDLHPREIWEGVPVPLNPELVALRTEAHARDIAWRQLQTGHSVEVGGVLMEVLNPPPPDWERQHVRNDDSLVLRLRFGDVELLLTGDAGHEFESRAASAEVAVVGTGTASRPLRILKVAHHGSLSSSSVAFLNAFTPDVALVSSGRGNVFGHPAPEVLARLQRLGARILRTDQEGAITIETDGKEVTVDGRVLKRS